MWPCVVDACGSVVVVVVRCVLCHAMHGVVGFGLENRE